MLILLFPDREGELKVVLTVRAKTLRNYAGQVALPGGEFGLFFFFEGVVCLEVDGAVGWGVVRVSREGRTEGGGS